MMSPRSGLLSKLMSTIGKPIPRKEGRKKVTGQALYVDDLTFPGMLHGVTVRSPVARGNITNISFDSSIPWDEFVIVTAGDIPGANHVALILDDQPYLAERVVNHPEEPVLLLAHKDKCLLEEARRSVKIEVEELPAIFSMDESLSRKQIIWGDDNVFKKFLVDKGNVDEAWASADFIVEGEYETGAQEQLYIENNGAIAVANPNEGVTVWGSMQYPYYVHQHSLSCSRIPDHKIRVIQTETGGGFGGKEEYPSTDRRSRGIAGMELRQACEDDLRQSRRHGRNYEATSIAHTSQNRRDQRRQTSRDGNRFCDRRRSVLHPVASRTFARHYSRCRTVLLSERSHH